MFTFLYIFSLPYEKKMIFSSFLIQYCKGSSITKGKLKLEFISQKDVSFPWAGFKVRNHLVNRHSSLI